MDVSRLLISEPAPDSPTTRPNKVPRMENNGGPSSPATTGFGGEPIERKPNHFGDILAPREITTVLPAGFTGLERIILSANGNLQRIMRYSELLIYLLIFIFYLFIYLYHKINK
jgi:hypothetical protein